MLVSVSKKILNTMQQKREILCIYTAHKMQAWKTDIPSNLCKKKSNFRCDWTCIKLGILAQDLGSRHFFHKWKEKLSSQDHGTEQIRPNQP